MEVKVYGRPGLGYNHGAAAAEAERVQFIRNIVSYHVYDRREEKEGPSFIRHSSFVPFIRIPYSLLLFLFVHSSSPFDGHFSSAVYSHLG